MELFLLALPALEEQQPQSPGSGSGLGSFLPILLILVVMMLFMPLLSRKERTRQKRLTGLKKHDRVVTSGGLYGTVISFNDQTAIIEVAKGMRLTFKRSSIYDIDKPSEGAPASEAPEKLPEAKG